jgi:hypothetical protein
MSFLFHMQCKLSQHQDQIDLCDLLIYLIAVVWTEETCKFRTPNMALRSFAITNIDIIKLGLQICASRFYCHLCIFYLFYFLFHVFRMTIDPFALLFFCLLRKSRSGPLARASRRLPAGWPSPLPGQAVEPVSQDQWHHPYALQI